PAKARRFSSAAREWPITAMRLSKGPPRKRNALIRRFREGARISVPAGRRGLPFRLHAAVEAGDASKAEPEKNVSRRRVEMGARKVEDGDHENDRHQESGEFGQVLVPGMPDYLHAAVESHGENGEEQDQAGISDLPQYLEVVAMGVAGGVLPLSQRKVPGGDEDSLPGVDAFLDAVFLERIHQRRRPVLDHDISKPAFVFAGLSREDSGMRDASLAGSVLL